MIRRIRYLRWLGWYLFVRGPKYLCHKYLRRREVYPFAYRNFGEEFHWWKGRWWKRELPPNLALDADNFDY
jgi:hypothetical protein